MEVADEIVKQPRDRGDRPYEDQRIKKVTVDLGDYTAKEPSIREE